MLIVCTHCHAANRVPEDRLTDDPVCGRCKQDLLDGHAVELTDASFDLVASRTELPVVVDFWAGWCGPCRMMEPHFKDAATRLKGRVLMAKVNSDENPQLAGRFGIRSLPTLLMLRQGRELKRQAGALQAAQIVGFANSTAGA